MGDLADFYDEIMERAYAEESRQRVRYMQMSLAEFIGAMTSWQEEVGNDVIASMLRFYRERGYLTDKQRRFAASIMAEAVI